MSKKVQLNENELEGKLFMRGNVLMSKMSIFLIIIIIITGCTADKEVNYKDGNTVSIAEQYGLAYAPLQIMKAKKLMEKNMPGIKVEWKQLGNTAAIREAMLAEDVDVGFMAIPPFLIGWDNGMKWKIASGLSISPVALVTYKDHIKSIKDFTMEDRIALPQPGSIQHILLSMACEKEFGDAGKLDDVLVTLAHPDGMNALLAKKEITAHFTAPPYLFKELEQKGMHQILDGNDVIGNKFTFIVGVATGKFHDEKTDTYKAFVKSLHEAIIFMRQHPEEASKMLAEIYQIPEDELFTYLTWKDTEYNSTVYGIHPFAEFMKKHGYISKLPEELDEILWEDVSYEHEDI
ncbi:MAG: ABC transporter substrate-binding protein [Bacillota bacterium]